MTATASLHRAGADVDGNGFITLGELVANLSGVRRRNSKPEKKNDVPSPRKPEGYNKADESRNARIRHAEKLLAYCDEDNDG